MRLAKSGVVKMQGESTSRKEILWNLNLNSIERALADCTFLAALLLFSPSACLQAQCANLGLKVLQKQHGPSRGSARFFVQEITHKSSEGCCRHAQMTNARSSVQKELSACNASILTGRLDDTVSSCCLPYHFHTTPTEAHISPPDVRTTSQATGRSRQRVAETNQSRSSLSLSRPARTPKPPYPKA